MTDTRSAPAAKPRRGRQARTPGRTTPALFYRQVVAELRKVIWPTRNQLVTYTIVVVVFVLIMVGIVSGLDFLLSQAVIRIFG